MGSVAAEVQVLTAEVRTLMVGSRQVTMSVFNQLDMVDTVRIEPFGRVNVKDARPGGLHVVGREKDSGALVRAVQERPDARPWLEGVVLHGVPDLNRYGGDRIIVVAGEECYANACEWHPFGPSQRSDGSWRPESQTTFDLVHAEAVANRDRWWREWAEWKQLPLIVLAGLR